jgi:hypothetical protein
MTTTHDHDKLIEEARAHVSHLRGKGWSDSATALITSLCDALAAADTIETDASIRKVVDAAKEVSVLGNTTSDGLGGDADVALSGKDAARVAAALSNLARKLTALDEALAALGQPNTEAGTK